MTGGEPGGIPPPLLERLCARWSQISVVADALTAFAASRGVHAMHDATEGGVRGGLWEMCASSGLSAEADLDAVPVPEDIAAIAAALGFDPWQAISEGTLLAAVDPGEVPRVLEAWSAAGIEGHVLGRFGPPGPAFVTSGGRRRPLPEPGVDPFWELFFAGLK